MPAMKCSQRSKRFSQSITYASIDHCLIAVPPGRGRSAGRSAAKPQARLCGSCPGRRACGLLLGQAALYPFDVEVHLLQLVVAHRLARGDAFLAAVVLERAL